MSQHLFLKTYTHITDLVSSRSGLQVRDVEFVDLGVMLLYGYNVDIKTTYGILITYSLQQSAVFKSCPWIKNNSSFRYKYRLSPWEGGGMRNHALETEWFLAERSRTTTSPTVAKCATTFIINHAPAHTALQHELRPLLHPSHRSRVGVGPTELPSHPSP